MINLCKFCPDHLSLYQRFTKRGPPVRPAPSFTPTGPGEADGHRREIEPLKVEVGCD